MTFIPFCTQKMVLHEWYTASRTQTELAAHYITYAAGLASLYCSIRRMLVYRGNVCTDGWTGTAVGSRFEARRFAANLLILQAHSSPRTLNPVVYLDLYPWTYNRP